MSVIRLVSVGLAALLMPAVALAEELKLEIKNAYATGDRGQPAIYFELTNKSGHDFFEFTEKNMNKPMIMRLDGREML
jgi:preprotein translocase subunit SecD